MAPSSSKGVFALSLPTGVLLLVLFFCNQFGFLPEPAALLTRPQVSDATLSRCGLDRKFHKCIAVADGDTITLEQIGPVRFIGIDTPEKNHPLLPLQYMAQESSEFTTRRCLSQEVRLDYNPHDEDFRDKYKRVLGYVYLRDGTLLQEELVRNGLAIAYTKYPLDESMRQRLLALEQEARKKEQGLWRAEGLAEVAWILNQQQPMIRVGGDGKGRYELFFAGRHLNLPGLEGVASEVAALHRRMYEFSPADFEKETEAAGYQRAEKPATEAYILVFAMAHGKWGLFHQGLVRPRILQTDLEPSLQAFFTLQKRQNEAGKLRTDLRSRGFCPTRALDYDPNNFSSGSVLPHERISAWLRHPKRPIIRWDQAREYMGRSVYVHGRIARSHNSGKACFLNFHNNFTRYLGAVIFESDFKRFPAAPAGAYLGRYVAIRGHIKEYQGRPEIVLEKPSQIRLLPE